MKDFIMSLLFNLFKLNPKMKVATKKTISLETFKILEEYKCKSDDPTDRGSIIDLGGGGEGIIGQIMGRDVTAVDLHEQELKGTPEGSYKVVADARDLPFEADSFYCATAFYFLMYLNPEDYRKVFEEAHRVLKASGRFIIWDVTIPKTENPRKRLFVVPLKVELPFGVVNTAYGTGWENKELNAQLLIQIAIETGFILEQNQGNNETIQLIFIKK